MIAQTNPRAEWLAERKTCIGASESAALFGHGYKSQSPYSIAAEKLGLINSSLDDDERLECGLALQSGILQLASRRIGCEITNPGEFVIHRHAEYPWLGATLDGVCLHPELGPAVVEAKNVDFFLLADWDDEEHPPLKFQVQCQHQMAVTGHKHAFLAGLIGGNRMRVRHIARNDRFIESTLIPRLAEFWKLVEEARSAIAAGQPPVLPPVDGSEATSDALSEVYARSSRRVAYLRGPELQHVAEEFDRVKLEIKRLEGELSLRKNQLIAAIGHDDIGIVDSGAKYSSRPHHKSGSRVIQRCK